MPDTRQQDTGYNTYPGQSANPFATPPGHFGTPSTHPMADAASPYIHNTPTPITPLPPLVRPAHHAFNQSPSRPPLPIGWNTRRNTEVHENFDYSPRTGGVDARVMIERNTQAMTPITGRAQAAFFQNSPSLHGRQFQDGPFRNNELTNSPNFASQQNTTQASPHIQPSSPIITPESRPQTRRARRSTKQRSVPPTRTRKGSILRPAYRHTITKGSSSSISHPGLGGLERRSKSSRSAVDLHLEEDGPTSPSNYSRESYVSEGDAGDVVDDDDFLFIDEPAPSSNPLRRSARRK